MATKKDGRFSLALKPYTLWAIKRLAEYNNVSANQYISDILDSAVAMHDATLKDVWTADEKARQSINPADAD